MRTTHLESRSRYKSLRIIAVTRRFQDGFLKKVSLSVKPWLLISLSGIGSPPNDSEVAECHSVIGKSSWEIQSRERIEFRKQIAKIARSLPETAWPDSFATD